MNNLHKAGQEPCSDRSTPSPPISILFVCLGNICKLPHSLPFFSPSTPPLPPPQQFPDAQLTTYPLPPTGRSPMAEAVFRSLLTTSSPHLARFARIDSAGTAAYHAGAAPDPRTLSTLAAHGITDYVHSARKVRGEDFGEFDYILAMDGENLRNLLRARGREGEGVLGRGREEEGDGGKEEGKGKVMLFGEFGGRGAEEVVDPYYGEGVEGFEVAFEQMVRFSERFLREVVGGRVGEVGGRV